MTSGGPPRGWTETEADTRAERIDPVLARAGWGPTGTAGSTIRREVLAPGRILTGSRRGKDKTADYVLIHRNRPLAVLEAKRHGLGAGAGVGQAKDYADLLGVRFAYASDGAEWYAIDMERAAEGSIRAADFPSPETLWRLTFDAAPTISTSSALSTATTQTLVALNDWRLRFGDVGFESGGGKWEPRYYQRRAVDAVTDAVGEKRKRILLTLATGTGKTSIAFQIAWRLFHARWNISGEPGRRARILFLADRNILANQAVNEFSPFASDAIVRIDPARIRKDGRVPKNGAVFFSIFQTLMTDRRGLEAMSEGGEPGAITEVAVPNYREYEPDFFDLIIIDECHRGGANDESTWRGILDYFAPAVQLGLTATPKRNANADTYAYFGEPVYEFALKTGIEDGYLTPFKVRQMASTMDEFVLRPGDTVDGDIEEGRTYTEAEINTIIEIPERERRRVEEFVGAINERQKTLVFCASQKHAAMVRDLVNQVSTAPDPLYCVRVTANDGDLGDQYLRLFQDNERTIPTVLTTSHKLSTGVDAKNVRNIVLMRPIRSIVEFKQIIGRGTRTFPGKDHFTILDFVKAYEHFQDPEWDGPPDAVEGAGGGRGGSAPTDNPPPRDDPPPGPDDTDDQLRRMTRVTLANGRSRDIRFMSTTTYWFDGRQISAAEFMERLFGDLSGLVSDEDQLRALWSDPDRRSALLRLLEEGGYDEARLDEMRRLIDAPNSDIFDVLAYVRFELATQTRRERADRVRSTDLGGYDVEMREFLRHVLANYERQGIAELDPGHLGNMLQVRYGAIGDAKRRLGDIGTIRAAFIGMQRGLYRK